MISNKLCNPSHKQVDIEWHSGIHIKIDPDGSQFLSNHQLQDFVPGQPGSENIQQMMVEHCVFLRDTDLSYEAQAVDCLTKAIRYKEGLYREYSNNIRSSRAASGIAPDEAALEETFKQLGLTRLREDTERLKGRLKIYKQELAEYGSVQAEEKIDPDRTLIFTDPPRTFESAVALKVFLSEPVNVKLKKQYEDWRKAYDAATTKNG